MCPFTTHSSLLQLAINMDKQLFTEFDLLVDICIIIVIRRYIASQIVIIYIASNKITTARRQKRTLGYDITNSLRTGTFH